MRKKPTGIFFVPKGVDEQCLGPALMRLGRQMSGFKTSDAFEITSDSEEYIRLVFGEKQE